jgi:hypothetical protein
MTKLIIWLSERKLFTLVITIAYTITVVLMHRQVNECFDWIRKQLSFRVYDDWLLYIGIFITIILGIFILWKVVKGEQHQRKILFLLCTIFLMVIGYEMLVVFSIELIHYPQYAILAILIFSLLKRFDETVFWVTLLGAIDEAYQYFVLYQGNKTLYLDFNEIYC